MEHWATVSGPYTLQTGRDLRDLPLHLMYDVAWDAVRRVVLTTKEETEVLEKLETTIKNQADMSEGDMPDWMSAFEVQRSPMPIG